MKILDIMLLVVCMIYGWIIAQIFGGDNYNNVWIWTSFILFVINSSVYKFPKNYEDEEE